MRTMIDFINTRTGFWPVWICLSLIAFLLFLNSCQPTGLTSIYSEPAFMPAPINKVLIIGMMEKEPIRKTFESVLARKFIDRGVDAVPSYKLMPTIKELNKEMVASKIEGMAFDSVLVTWPIRTGQEKLFIPMPDSKDENSLDEFFKRYHSVAGTDYQLNMDLLYLENRLYETIGGRLVWASHTKEFDINSNQVGSVIDLFSRMVISDLAMNNFVR
jgi:hypothetical protein